MDWIYLSPHLDDVALSVGGLLWEQSQAGERVEIWTICAGDPPPGDFSPFAESLHARWETGSQSMSARRAEDVASCQRLGVDYIHLAVPDCIYRRSPFTGEHLYASEESLWIPVQPDEEPLIAQLAEQFKTQCPSDANLVCPLTLGGHVDHRLTRAAAEKLGIPLWFYADYPYVLETETFSRLENRPSTVTPISPDGLIAWQEAISAHRSQISTFWQSLSTMHKAILAYYRQMGGVRLFSSE
jgi:LmbE family N-acetylglucosaminyl deacetylase